MKDIIWNIKKLLIINKKTLLNTFIYEKTKLVINSILNTFIQELQISTKKTIDLTSFYK